MALMNTPRKGVITRSSRSSEATDVKSHGLGYILKPDTYDESVLLHVFFTQFNFITRTNNWNESKVIILVTSLRGKARAILNRRKNYEELQYSELEARLPLHFGEGYVTQTFYTQFTNWKQKFGDDICPP